MDTAEIERGTNQKVELGAAEIMTELAKEAEQLIGKVGKIARQEAEQEMGRILHQYEQRTKQIVLKIKEENKARAAEMADALKEAIMLRIEQASSDAIASVIAQSSRKVEELVRKRQEIDDEGEPEPAETKPEASDNVGSTRPEKEPEPKGEDVELDQPVEDFDRWLSQ